MRLAKMIAIAAAAAAPSLGQAAATTWTIDVAHSAVSFGVKHMMVSTVRGTFNTFTGSVTAEGEDPTTAVIDVSIDAASIDTRDAKRDEHLRSADFLDVANHPTVTFRSTKVERAGNGLRIVGNLTLRGVTREVVLSVDDLTPPIADPWGSTRVGAHATATINRKDFGVSWSKVMDNGGLVVGDEVAITLDVELVKQNPQPAAATK